MHPTNQVNISIIRYVELLELENQSLKSMLAVKPVRTPSSTGCVLSEITKKIHASGKTLKRWSHDHGFRYQSVRNIVCGFSTTPVAIREALVAEGFMEA